MDKKTTLLSALEAREEEIFHYQIDIDNFERAINKINSEFPDDKSLVDFKDHLLNLLQTNKREQRKAIIIRDVITEQLDELNKEKISY